MSGSPIDSPERLAALQRSGLMDSPTDAAFDALVELARDLLGGTVALVALVDDRRQFFKAQVGLGEPWASARETPLSHSFCQHVVNGNGPFLVENARTDARVKDSRAMDELGVIAYAGIPLVDEGDHPLGALCVIDGQPRAWTEKDVRTLKTLAKAVMAEVRVRQALVQTRQEAHEREQLLHSLQSTQTALSRSLERTRQVVEAVGAGIWELDVATGKVETDARTNELMGLVRDGSMTLDSGLGLIDPQQSARVAAASEAALRGENGGRYHLEFRTGGRNGIPMRWVESRAQAFFDTGGKATRLAGVNLDITARKGAEALREELFQRVRDENERQRLMFEQAPACIALLEGPEHHFRIANARYIQLVGGRQVLGRSVAEALPEVIEQGFIALLDTVHRTGVPYVGRETWLQLRRRPEEPLEDVCLDFIYQPIRNTAGQVSAIFVHAVEVTDLVRSREAAQLAVQELKSLTETLRANEERLDLALDVVGAGIWEMDLSTQEVLADRRFRDLFGLTWEESFSWEKGLAIVHPEDRARVATAIADAIAGKNGGVYEADYRTVPRADGSARWVAARGQAFFTPEGKARRFIGTGVDISERKNAEAEREELVRQARTSEAHLRLIMDALPVLISFVTADERYGVVNKAYEEWFGIAEEQLIGRKVREIIGEAAYAVLGPFVRRGLAGETFSFEQYTVPYRLGGTRDVKASFTPYRMANGRVEGYVAMLQDITELRRLERERDLLVRREAEAHAEAEAARSRLAKFVENAPAALGTVRGPHHVFELVNPRYQELMGKHRQLLGRPMAEAAPEVVAQGFIQLFDTVYRTGEPFFAEGIPAQLDRRGDGTLEDVFFNLTFQPVRDLQGQVEGVDIFGFDVTAQVRLRQQEEELKRLAEERAVLEQQLVGIVSHDLRNPLGAILLAASTLAHNPTLNERGLKSVLRISAAAERAGRMVKDLLDFTQARLGKGIPVYPRALNLAQELEGWVEEARAAFPERSVNVHVQGPGQVRADPDRMAQVVGNLVSNALKYSPPDSPVEVRLGEEPGTLVLEVHNTGSPIPESQQVRVFQPLERGLEHRDMSSRSVGLGLFIVKHVVEAHGGSVSVTSTLDAGTTFAVRLPRA